MDWLTSFPWTTLIGILGTLGGGALGHRYATKQAENQRAHENLTRFHGERLSAAARFLGASLTLRAIRTLGRKI